MTTIWIVLLGLFFMPVSLALSLQERIKPLDLEARSLDSILMTSGKDFTYLIPTANIAPSGLNGLVRVNEADGVYVIHGNQRYGPYKGGVESKLTTINNDGSKVGYIAMEKDQWLLYLNGKLLSKESPLSRVYFSPNGENYAYLVESGKSNIVQTSFGFEYMAEKNGIPLVFSPDNTHLAFPCRDGVTLSVVENGKPGERLTTIVNDSLVYSPNGKLGYLATTNYKHVAVIDRKIYQLPTDGLPLKHYEPPALTFNADGSKFAAVGYDGYRYRFYLNGEQKGIYRKVQPESFIFSPDGSRYGFIIEDEKFRACAVIDGKIETQGGELIQRLMFSKNGKRYLYRSGMRAVDDPEEMLPPSVLAVDGKPYQKSKDSVIGYGAEFSDDGKNLIYWEEDKEGNMTAWWNKEKHVIGKMPEIKKSFIEFTPDQKGFYAGFYSEKEVVVYSSKDKKMRRMTLDEGMNVLRGQTYRDETVFRLALIVYQKDKEKNQSISFVRIDYP